MTNVEETNLHTQGLRAVHMFLRALKLMNLGEWSEQLKGVAPLDLGVLAHVSRDPDILLGDIRRAMDIPHSTLTSAVNRLERKGMLRRVISDKDRRSYGLALTKSGRDAQAEHERLDNLLVSAMFKAMESDDERAAFIALLEKAAQGLNDLES